MLFLIYVNPHAGINRMELYKKFEKNHSSHKELKAAIGIQRTFKIVGRDETYLVIRAKNLIFLEQALSPLQDQADIRVTPVIELE